MTEWKPLPPHDSVVFHGPLELSSLYSKAGHFPLNHDLVLLKIKKIWYKIENHLKQIQDDCWRKSDVFLGNLRYLDRATETVTPTPLNDTSIGNNTCFINIPDSLLNQ